MNRWLWPVLIVLVLGACTGVPTKTPEVGNETAFQDRMESIGSIDEWQLRGKISLDDGDRGGSGKLQWMVNPDNSTIDFHGAMGRGAWHLEIEPDLAVLTEANGSMYQAASVDALIRQQMGWPVPVEALKWWVRGLAAPGSFKDKQLDAQGLLIKLEQFGWQIEFNRYSSSSGVPMPSRLDATRGTYRVKLAISRWQISADPVAN